MVESETVTEKIDHKHPGFQAMCRVQGIMYPATVHHFEVQENGSYKPVLWHEVTIDKSPTEREIGVEVAIGEGV